MTTIESIMGPITKTVSMLHDYIPVTFSIGKLRNCLNQRSTPSTVELYLFNLEWTFAIPTVPNNMTVNTHAWAGTTTATSHPWILGRHGPGPNTATRLSSFLEDL